MRSADLIAGAPAAGTARVKLSLDVQLTPNLKTATIWGTLPGTTDETVFVVAHRDGWFEAANDNGTGVATMLGLAEYFAKIPRRSGSERSCSSARPAITTARRRAARGSCSTRRSSRRPP